MSRAMISERLRRRAGADDGGDCLHGGRRSLGYAGGQSERVAIFSGGSGGTCDRSGELEVLSAKPWVEVR